MKEKLTPEEEFYLSEARLNRVLTIRNYVKIGLGCVIALLLVIWILILASMFF